MMDDETLLRAINDHAVSLEATPGAYDAVLELVGDASVVLLGEASHGTHEFYRARADITRRLIEEKGFTAVAVEADWPDAHRVHQYIRGRGEPDAAGNALAAFQRFPTWMWRNADVLRFVRWMRAHNDGLANSREKVGFYGLDLYSLYASINAVIRYLQGVDPAAAQRARDRYACFEAFGSDGARYGLSAAFGESEQSCEEEVVAQLVDMQKNAANFLSDSRLDEDYFIAQQNARVAKNAEAYYRAMYRGREDSWNLRDTHMAQTLDQLRGFLSGDSNPARICIWAHNSHIGDARRTQFSARGELNLGQLVREKYAEQTRLVGFTTYTGSVTAADGWDEPEREKEVRRGLPGSWEALLHQAELDNFFLDLRQPPLRSLLQEPRLERAIGVVYLPETERWSHYFEASLAAQFDGVLHFDRSSAVQALAPAQVEAAQEPPETFPHKV